VVGLIGNKKLKLYRYYAGHTGEETSWPSTLYVFRLKTTSVGTTNTENTIILCIVCITTAGEYNILSFARILFKRFVVDLITIRVHNSALVRAP